MAHLTGTQKKNRNVFIALCVAIVLVIAAIALVVYNGLTVASFGNEDVEKTVAESLDKKAGSLKKDDLAKVKYVEIVNSGVQVMTTFGYDDFLTQLAAYEADQEVIAKATEEHNNKLDELANAAKLEAEAKGEAFDEEAFYAEEHDTGVVIPEAKVVYPTQLAKSATAETTGALIDMNDIKYFTGAKNVQLMGGKVDVKNLKGLKNVTKYSFIACDFENFEEFAKLDFTKIQNVSIDISCGGITENNLNALKPYADKISLAQYYNLGNGMVYNMGEMLLSDYFANIEAAENAEITPEVETPDENSDEQTSDENSDEQISDENSDEQTPDENLDEQTSEEN